KGMIPNKEKCPASAIDVPSTRYFMLSPDLLINGDEDGAVPCGIVEHPIKNIGIRNKVKIFIFAS
ncbi:MAG: hypothetical protein Q8M94_09280, partial [Ignavibacteria bacterium]|nr:hypothetical protein [Ignavibacteria bacterium]